MKCKIVPIAFMLLVAVVLAICVSAQTQTNKEQESSKAQGAGDIGTGRGTGVGSDTGDGVGPGRGMGSGSGVGSGMGPYVRGNGVKNSPGKIVLIQAVIRNDGTVDSFKILPTPASTVSSGKLQIEMQDGSVQEIDLKKVKKITIEP